MASFYMDSPALSWYQWMFRNGFFSSWPAMLQDLESHFALSFYDDPQGALFKLQQYGTVNEYLTEFERLANCIVGLARSCVAELARLQEDKILNHRRSSRLGPVAPLSPLPKLTGASPSTRLLFKHLTIEEMVVCRDQGLCYHCNDKWSPGHRCKPRLHLLIADEEVNFSSEPTLFDTSSPPTVESAPIPHISLNAMEGTLVPETFRLLGFLHNHRVVILVDGGSTHNFIQSYVAKFLRPPSSRTPLLRVMVGNGHTLDCDTFSLQVPLSIQGHDFTIDLFQLPLCGAYIVLGMQWLKHLGPITTDYTSLTMTFSNLGQQITLHADAPHTPSPTLAHQLKCLAQTQSISALFHITPIPEHPFPFPTHIPSSPPPHITSILDRYPTIFAEPTQLPPCCTIQHHIHLFPNTHPINVKPYRYPHFQKSEIEKQISTMLAADLIQPSHNPYSSPVLLVKKKDGTWRCCVDYKALNAVTVKDRFPMPMVDELLDDLGHASCFSKLDLHQGFHQI
ncbi:uncharacterized protein [Glycine max]|uniref:uncharacterized protein n=1 Tax=Glycine max TaxID=3847 RepID=UPI0003DECECF|nr:uncharacterized protein LOC102669335 [Glycine max]|eukprot:XP_006596879.1 uncharacterized protein LOC102669335 [Glycine max]